MQVYDDPVEVRRSAPDDLLDEPRGDAAAEPAQFLWRGRLWKVRAVLAHRVETRARRRDVEALRLLPGADARRELWRVRAGRGGLEADGVFDLSFDEADGTWQLVGGRPGQEVRP